MSDETLYAQLGERAAIAVVVDRFYERVLTDEHLAHFFEDVEMTALRAHQTQFLSTVTGGPIEYTGREMHAAHAHLDLTEDHFERVAIHLRDTLSEFGVPDAQTKKVMDAVWSLKDTVLAE